VTTSYQSTCGKSIKSSLQVPEIAFAPQALVTEEVANCWAQTGLLIRLLSTYKLT